MQRYLSTVAKHLAATGSLLWTRAAFAQNALTEPPDIADLSPEANLTDVIIRVIEIILDFVLILAVLYVIIAGLRLIISGGDEGEKDAAKKTIIYVIAGIVVILFARAVVLFVKNAVLNTD